MTSGLRITPGLRVRSGLRVTQGLRRPGEMGFVGPLDLMGSSPILALSSVYRLTDQSWGSDDGVTDPLLRLYRESDADERNFSYGGNTNTLDTLAVDAWRGASAVRVVKTFDQTGNGQHAVQSTPTSAPVYAGLEGWDFGATVNNRYLEIAHDTLQWLTSGPNVFMQISLNAHGEVNLRAILTKQEGLSDVAGWECGQTGSVGSRSYTWRVGDSARLSAGTTEGVWQNVLWRSVGSSLSIYIDQSPALASSADGAPGLISTTAPITIGRFGDSQRPAAFRSTLAIVGPPMTDADRDLLLALEKPA